MARGPKLQALVLIDALVLCVDEKTSVQALDRTAPLLPLRPGQPERRTHDYTRYGTTLLFAALDVATGKVIARCHPWHRAVEFRKFLGAASIAASPNSRRRCSPMPTAQTH